MGKMNVKNISGTNTAEKVDRHYCTPLRKITKFQIWNQKQ